MMSKSLHTLFGLVIYCSQTKQPVGLVNRVSKGGYTTSVLPTVFDV